MRTPLAVLDREVKHSVLALFQKEVREKIKRGGPQGDMAAAEIIVGTSTVGIIGTLAAAGMVTGGGPSRSQDPRGEQRKALMATGWQVQNMSQVNAHSAFTEFEEHSEDADSDVSKGDEVVVIESVKVASDILAPLDGQIVEVNDALGDTPDLVNSAPLGDGWIFKMNPPGAKRPFA